MEADFSGWATKAGLKCSDGRTIMDDAFKQQHKQTVPLVWQHGHSDPTNVLGHAVLESRPGGVYCYAFFNKTAKAQHAKEAVQHKDITKMSIWANELIERAKMVYHGAIREVSLVLSGANPGAVIENISIRHSDDDLEDTVLEDEAIIHTGFDFEFVAHSDEEDDDMEKDQVVTHADDDDDDGETIQDVYDSMSDKQKDVLHFMVGQALEEAGDEAKHSDVGSDDDDDDDDIQDDTDTQKGNEMKHHNVFEDEGGSADGGSILSHDDMVSIVDDAKALGSLKRAVGRYALEHGITDIDTLFPDAKAVSNVPEWISRRTEWVSSFLGAVRKSPFSRIKTLNADITHEEARAKGYIKGSLKKEEFFGVASRSTTPTTVYKKQALDRDDIVDITDFDVVAWLKGEMRLMLDEEIARAALIGDGRDIADEDKINEQNIRPIAKDHELYTTTVNVNVGDANSSMTEVIDAVITNRYKLKGTGSPNFYTTEYWLGRFFTLRDNDGHRMYKTLQDLAAELRVAAVIPVEVMQDDQTMIGVLVNPVDYVMGATAGGEVNMFDDFDIDYNKEKYLIETRLSGALVKIKSAMVLRATDAASVLVVPAAPTFDEEAGEVTIVDTAGVVYKDGDGVTIDALGSPYSVAPGETYVVNATPAAGKHFATSDDDSWEFTAPEA